MKNNLLLIFLLCSMGVPCEEVFAKENRKAVTDHCQTTIYKNIKGLVKDADGKPIQAAVVTELYAEKNLAGNIVQTDSMGCFSIELQQQKASLYVTYLGYEPQMVDLMDKNLESVEIKLIPSAAFSLDEVNVVAYKKAVEVKHDRLVYDMSVSPAKETSALEAFRFVPLISADESSFSIVGKDQTVVYINNRKSNMNPENLLGYLKSLPAENIQAIEVITNPRSTFRGEGNFGIIHIRLKGHEFEGLKGNAMARLWKTHYMKESGDLNLSYAHGKSMTNLSVGAANYSTWKEAEMETNYLNSPLRTNKESVYDNSAPEFYTNLQSDYQLNKNSTLGLVFNAYHANGHGDETGLTSFSKGQSTVVDSLIDMQSNFKNRSTSLALNTNYRFSADDGKEYAMVDFDYLYKKNQNYSQSVMNNLNPDMSIRSNYLNFEQNVPMQADLFSGKVEYGNTYKNFATVKFGADAYYSKIINDNNYRTWEQGTYVNDPLLSNEFEINETTGALFLQLDRSWVEKLSVSLGARLEYTYNRGVQHTSKEEFDTDYLRLLPSLSLSYRPSNQHNINYNASYRISRPTFSSLNPFVQYTSPTNYFVGNPFLQPSGYWYQSVMYGLNSKYFLSASFNVTDDSVNPIQILKENNVIENTLVNMGKVRTFRTWFNTSQRYWKGRGNSNLNITYEWKQVQGVSEAGGLDYTHSSVHASLQNNLELSQKFKIYFDYGGRYNSKLRNSYFEFPASLNLNAALRKSIKSFQVTLYTNLAYYLYDGKFTQTSKVAQSNESLNGVEYIRNEPTSVGLSISYNFGNSKVKGAQYRSTSNEGVKSRVN